MIQDKYRILREEYLENLQSKALFLEHNQTKAQILLLENSNDNKTFSIAFKTPPTDSTGVAHIVEHSTLSGSRKYKTREPFMDMVSSSLQTFLNAMTYPDKTVYPISSRNDKDFQQLMDLYLDSVFYPRMDQVKEIFLQEGWHKEINEEVLTYNGVVYNEMKGVYSDPSNQVSDLIRESLHPQGTYHHDSGGNPRIIPSLTYENFLDFHRNYYHPSNSYILLSGKMDFEEKLAYLDQEYLCHFAYLPPKSKIIGHPPYKVAQSISKTYSTSLEEYSENKSYLALAWNIKENPSPMDLLLRSFFAELLVESDTALVKKKLLERGIGEDIYTESSTSYFLDFSLIAYHAHKDQFPEFYSTIMDTLSSIVKEGISKLDLEATLNKFEFSVRKGGGSHRDLIAYLGALNTWLYGQDPIDGLNISPLLDQMRQWIDTDFYEKKIEEWFIHGQNRVQGTIEGEIAKEDREEEKLKAILSQEYLSLKAEEKESIIRAQERLRHFQMAEDSPEAKASIPKLELSDIPKDIGQIPREIIHLSGLEGTFNPLATNGIVYGTFAFPIDHLSLEEMVNVSILSDLLSRLGTENFQRDRLSQEVFLRTGGIAFETPVEVHCDNKDFTPYLLVNIAMMEDKVDVALEILEEIIYRTDFSQDSHILEVLYSSKSDMESSILQSAHSLSMGRLKSYFHKASYVDETINGLDLYFTLSSLLKDFQAPLLREKMELVYKKIFSRKGLRFNIRCEEKNKDRSLKSFEAFLNNLQDRPWQKKLLDFSPKAKNEAFITSSQVNYVAKGYNLALLDQEYRGEFAVLANILSSKYLHYNIRAKGGAYGAGIQFSRSLLVSTYSYRDPNLDKTIEIYDSMGDYLRTLDLSQRELSDFIIGTMNSFDPHLSPEALGLMDFKRYLNGLSHEQLSQWKSQALGTSLKTIKEMAPLLDQLMEKDYICLIGNEKQIKASSHKFGQVQFLKQ